MATREQLERALKNADAAGDVDAARKLANALKSGSYENSQQQAQVNQTEAQPRASVNSQQPQEQGFLDAAKETAGFLGDSVLKQVEGGLKGLYELAVTQDPDKANAAIQSVMATLSPESLSPRSQGQLQDIGTAVETVSDVANVPISGISGLAEIAASPPMDEQKFIETGVLDSGEKSRQGFEQASKTVGDVQQQGLSATLGERALEKTDSPLVATIAYTTPDAIMSMYGLRAGKTAVQNIPQSPTKQRIGRILQEGKIDERTAGWKLQNGSLAKGDAEPLVTPAEKFADTLRVGAPRIEKFKPERNALSQGWGKDIVAIASGVNRETKNKLSEMIQTQKDILYAPIERRKRRASDTVGKSAVERFNHVYEVNKATGEKLDDVAKNLQGQQVDLDNNFDSFFKSLADDFAVRVDEKFKPDFADSLISDSEGNQRVISTVLNRLKKLDQNPDAYQAHFLKKYIDEQVSYGKLSTDKPITQKTEMLLKDLRREIDDTLDSNFPEYNEVNSIYSETITGIDDLQKALGKKIDLTAEGSGDVVGSTLRSLMSNNRGRGELSKAINDIETIANRYDGNFNDDIFAQVVFADALDDYFGTAAKTSFKGDIQSATKIPKPDKNVVMRQFEKVGEKINELRFNKDKAIESMQELLKSEK